MRTILAATVRMMDAALWWCAESNRHLQSTGNPPIFNGVQP
jgi:hypothetical protein